MNCPRYGAPCPHPRTCAAACVYRLRAPATVAGGPMIPLFGIYVSPSVNEEEAEALRRALNGPPCPRGASGVGKGTPRPGARPGAIYSGLNQGCPKGPGSGCRCRACVGRAGVP